MKNILIVESKNDEIFIRALLADLGIEQVKVEEIGFVHYSLDSQADKPTKLIQKLKDIATDIPKKGIEKIGVVLDIDKATPQERLSLINNAFIEVFETQNFTPLNNISTATKLQFEGEDLEVLCYFMNVNGQGELDTVLKEIATENTIYADCLASWRKCLEENGETVSDKDFDKFWIANYIRFDTCTKKQSKQASRKCSMENFEYIMEKGIFDLSHEVLEGLRDFLKLF